MDWFQRKRWWFAVGALGAAAAAVLAGLSWLSPGSGPAAEAMAPPGFVEESVASGIDHVYDGEFSFFVGGGVAAFDCDDDRKPDLFLAGGENGAALYRNESPVAGSLRFEPVPSADTDLTGVTGAYPVDVDGDGVTDLAVLRLGENILLRGRGDCRFERANEVWGFDGGNEWTAAFSAKWEGSAALPTLAFGNYLAVDDRGTATGGCSDNSLVRPDSSGSFASPVALNPGWCTLSVLFTDWDRSGRGDLRITNDRHYYRNGEEQLWNVAPGEPPRLYSRDDGWRKVQIFGMGIASHDVTGDGFPEVFLTSMGDNKLQTLVAGEAQPSYGDIARDSGVTAHRPFVGNNVMPSTAWHAEFQDVNNDGFIDLFIAKGNVEAMPDFASADPNNLLLGQADGTFTESAEEAGILSFARTRGAAVVDFNLDGMLDIVQVNRREGVQLFRSVGWGTGQSPMAMGSWLAIDLAQPGPNLDAIGAWIEVEFDGRTVRREMTIGGGHAGGQLGWVHFGLGNASKAKVRVQWPDGEVGPWLRLDADRFAIIERGADEPRTWVSPGEQSAHGSER